MSYFIRAFNFSLLRRIPCALQRKMPNVAVRSISTSNKKDDTTTIAEPNTTQEDITSVPKKKKFFYDYGFGGESEMEEKVTMHFTFFIYVTLGLAVPFFYFTYRPKFYNQDWAFREAFLELRRREELGLPLIDPNYVDPATIYLPSDEELGDTEIIV